MNLFDIFEQRKVDYSIYEKELYFKNKADELTYDISVIIPVRGRIHFMTPVFHHLWNSYMQSNGKLINITYVEYSILPEYLRKCPTSYIWIPCNPGDKFNKCICFNVGFLYGPKAKKYLFYDSDLLCYHDFFEKLPMDNESYQTFKGRRVIYANSNLTTKFLQGVNLDESVTETHPDITIGKPGAPGGSILTTRENFILAGGYDAEFFSEYSVEDQVFFDKLSILGEVKSLDFNLVHLFHGDDHAKTKKEDMDLFEIWKKMPQNEREQLMELRFNHLSKFIS